MRRLLGAAAATLLLVACAQGPTALERSDPSVAPLSPPPGSGATPEVAITGDCPVAERRFCQEASALANALTQRSSDAVVTLSRPRHVACADVDPDVYTQCDERDELDGYAMGDYQGHVFLVTPPQYRRNIRFFVEAVDEKYSDELGGPEVRVLGVSSCGSGDQERSYHLAYTVGLGDPQSTSPGDRFLGTYEFTERDRGWAISVAHFGLLTDWELVLDEPLSQIGCGGVQAWGG
ncbi:MAG: hypothetical protein ACXWXP_08370 [Actinomycetota bacterium]